MYAVIYLDRERRIEVYAEGGLQQERYIHFNGKNKMNSDWYLANDEDWPELSDVLLKFSTLLFNAHNNLKVIDEDNYRQSLIERFGEKVIYEAESYYETDFGKEFWRDLDEEEQLDYIMRAKRNVEKESKKDAKL